MYINNMIPYKVKTENKCNKLFRPWDCISTSVDNSQDCTISTTTIDEVQEKSSECKNNTVNESDLEKEGFRPLNKTSIQDDSQSSTISYEKDRHQAFVLDTYGSGHPELIHTDFIQTVGIAPTDPLLLESMAQGFALEEYARVLNQEHQAKLLAAKKQRPKKYKCPHCDVGFSNNGQLKGHIRIHTGERPFKCDEKECGKTFTRNEELTRHKRIHSGLRPFPCSHCGKRFGRKDHLKKHSRTHFQPRGLYAVPVMLPFDTWASGSSTYPFIPMIGY